MATLSAGDELLCGIGSETSSLDVPALRAAVQTTLDGLGPRERVLIVPPVRVCNACMVSDRACNCAADRGCAHGRTSPELTRRLEL